MCQAFIIRAATADDATEVANVYLRLRKQFLPYAPLAHSDDGVRVWVREALIPSNNVIVAERGGAILGMLATSHERGVDWIDQLYLDPQAVGQGIGTLLLEDALAHLQPPVRLYTFQANVDARRFYERHGFVAIEFSDGQRNEENCPDVLDEWRGKVKKI
jgi:ribosomal protein S18 acetylase RimI-like enzyme